MSHDRPGQRPQRLSGDGGAVLVEAALVTPVLVLLVMGVLEFGYAWRNENVVAGSVRGSARVATQSLSNAQADRYAIESYLGSIAQGRNLTTNKIIIYKVDESTNPNGTVPSACLSASTSGSPPYGVSGVCNVYIPSQWTSANLVSSNFGCGSGKYDNNFCPTTSRTAALPATPTTVGVYADVTYSMLTKILPGRTINLSDRSVARVEPSPV